MTYICIKFIRIKRPCSRPINTLVYEFIIHNSRIFFIRNNKHNYVEYDIQIVPGYVNKVERDVLADNISAGGELVMPFEIFPNQVNILVMIIKCALHLEYHCNVT